MRLDIIKEALAVFDKWGTDRLPTEILSVALKVKMPNATGPKGFGSRSQGWWLRSHLESYGIKPRNIRHDGRVVKGYIRQDFEHVAFLPSTAVNVVDVFQATEQVQPAVLQGVCGGCGAARLGRPGAWRPCWRCRTP